jgi:uncharacterized membrane protein
MFRIENGTQISKPVEEVFTYVTSIAHRPEWMSKITMMTTTPQGAIGVGTILHARLNLFEQIVETTFEVIEWAPARSFACKSIMGPISSLVCLRFESVAAGTRLALRLEYEFHGLLDLSRAKLAGCTIERTLQADLLTLKDALECN